MVRPSEMVRALCGQGPAEFGRSGGRSRVWSGPTASWGGGRADVRRPGSSLRLAQRRPRRAAGRANSASSTTIRPRRRSRQPLNGVSFSE